ncbi:MAG: helix-hairpin-helix domain-containing protein, partial [Candidatus Eisenbacteria bacterium]|nr:helix-hairpin-helix domain-containing protein [Candidatus Eisenbacteria bacterium]
FGTRRQRQMCIRDSTHFGSVKRLTEASVEEIARVDSMGPAMAERVYAHLHAPQAAEEEDLDDEVRAASLEDADGKP